MGAEARIDVWQSFGCVFIQYSSHALAQPLGARDVWSVLTVDLDWPLIDAGRQLLKIFLAPSAILLIRPDPGSFSIHR